MSEVIDAETLSAIDTAIDDLGPDGAFRAVLFAMDDGYDSAQITESMAAGTLDADGLITGVTPNRPAFDLIDRSGPSAQGNVTVLAAGLNLALGPAPLTAEEFKRDILDDAAGIFLGIEADRDSFEAEQRERDFREVDQDEARAIIGLLLALGGAGYDLDQIVEHFVLGSHVVRVSRECVALADIVVSDPDGFAYVVPASAGPRSECSGMRDEYLGWGYGGGVTTSTTTAAAGAEPSAAATPLLYLGTFTNTGTMEFKTEPAGGRPQVVTCVQTGDAALTVFADGRAAATLVFTEIVDFDGGCRSRDEPLIMEAVGTAEGGMLSLAICGAVLEGTYDDDALSGSVTCLPAETEMAIGSADLRLDLLLDTSP